MALHGRRPLADRGRAAAARHAVSRRDHGPGGGPPLRRAPTGWRRRVAAQHRGHPACRFLFRAPAHERRRRHPRPRPAPGPAPAPAQHPDHGRGAWAGILPVPGPPEFRPGDDLAVRRWRPRHRGGRCEHRGRHQQDRCVQGRGLMPAVADLIVAEQARRRGRHRLTRRRDAAGPLPADPDRQALRGAARTPGAGIAADDH